MRCAWTVRRLKPLRLIGGGDDTLGLRAEEGEQTIMIRFFCSQAKTLSPAVKRLIYQRSVAHICWLSYVS